MVTFSAGATFHLNGDEIRAFHVPRAHTDGDAIVHFAKSDVIHMGDMYFNGLYPFIDTSSGGHGGRRDRRGGPGARAGRPTGRRSSRATARCPTRRRCGPTATCSSTVSGRIRQMIREGRKLEEITASKVTADFDEKWGKGFIPPHKFAEMVAMNLLKNAP